MPEVIKRRRPLRTALKVIAIGLLVVVLIVVGLLVWLRSSSGSGFIYRQVVSILDQNGFKLSAGSFEGPLPGHLLIRDAVLADQDGPIVKIGLLEMEIRLLPLARGLVHVPLVKVENPELIRIPAGSDQPEESSGQFALPVDIRLDRLSVTGGRIQANAFNALGLSTPELALAAGGLARLEGESSALDFKASLTELDGGELAAVIIKLDGGPNGSGAPLDQLHLSMKVQDRPGGLLSGLLEDPNWPGLNLALEGRGPINDWRGRLEFLSGAWGDLSADLVFQGGSGNLWRDLVDGRDWRAHLTAGLKPGSDLPAELLQIVGEQAKLDLAGALNEQNLTVDLKLDASGEPPIKLASQLSGVLAPGGGDFKLNASLDGFWPPDSQLISPIQIATEAAVTDKSQSLRNLKISGEGLDLSGGLDRRPTSGAVGAKLELRLSDGSPLLGEALRLADLAPDYFSGAINLIGELNWQGPTEKADGRLEVSGRNLVWPAQELNDLLGTNLDLITNLSGGGAQPFVVEINQVQAGLAAIKGRVGFKPDEVTAESEFSVDLQAALGSLTPLSPDLSGSLTLALAGAGRLNDFQGEIGLGSPEISGTPGVLKQVLLKTTVGGSLLSETENSGPDLSGHLEADVKDSPGGPLNLAAGWRFQQKSEDLSLALSDLSGNLAELELAGDLSAELGGQEPRLNGGLKADIADWSKLAALTGQPLSGSPATLQVSLSAPEGRQRAEAELELPGLRLAKGKEESLSLRGTSLAFKAEDLFGRPDLDLDLSLGSGEAGPLSWQGGAVKAEGQGGLGQFSVDIKQMKMAGAGGAGRDGLKLAGEYNLADEPTVDLKQLALSVGSSGMTLKEPLRLSLGENLKISPFSAAFRPSGQLTAEVDLTPGAIKIKTDLKKLPYSFFNTFAGAELPTGEIQSLTVDLDQGPGGLAGDFALTAQASPKELKNIKPVLNVKGRLNAGPNPNLTLEGTVSGGSGWKADGKFSAEVPLIPGADGGFPQARMNGPLKGELTFSGPLSPLWALMGQPDSSLSGMAQVQAEIGGTLNKPLPQGTAYVAGGRFEDHLNGIMIQDITLEAHSTPELPLKALLSAKDSRRGGVALEAQLRDLKKPSVSVRGRLSRFSPLNRDDILIFISGDLGAEGPLDRLALSSDLTVDRGEVDLKIIQAGNSIVILPISLPGDQIIYSSDSLRFNLKVKVPGKFFIRGDGLDSEWKGELSIGGSSRRPSIVGQLSPVRGYFAFAAKEFQFNKGDIAFNGGTMPSLNLELVNNGPDITAILRATGMANHPKLALESRPPLPEEEVLAHVLFGKSASSISRFEALQLASALNDLRNFGKGGNFNLIGLTRTRLGLDVLRLGGTDNDRERRASDLTGSMGQEMSGSGSASATQSDDISVEAGKYISDNVYVGVEHSGSAGAAVSLEVELAPSVSLEARSSTESTRVGVGWKKDY